MRREHEYPEQLKRLKIRINDTMKAALDVNVECSAPVARESGLRLGRLETGKGGHVPLKIGRNGRQLEQAELPGSLAEQFRRHPLLSCLMAVEAGMVRSTGVNLEFPKHGDGTVFAYCVDGNGWCEVAGIRHTVSPGDLFYFEPRFACSCGPATNQTWSIAWVRVEGSHVSWYLGELASCISGPVCALGTDARWQQVFQEVIGTLECGAEPNSHLCASQLLGHVLATAVRRRSESGRDKNEPDVWSKIDQSMAYMRQHLDKPVQVATLASLVSLSPSHYTAMFKRRTGCAPIDYFIRLRMQRACHLLSATPMNVKEIAAALGYDDPFYFSRVFKSVNRVAPSDYRLMHKQGDGPLSPLASQTG